MKVTLIILTFFIIEATSSHVDTNETEFEETFHIISDETSKLIQAEELQIAVEEINKQNEKFEKGEALFAEGLNEFSNLPLEDFEKEKLGLLMTPVAEDIPPLGHRYNGVIVPSEEIINDPINRAKLERAYEDLDRIAIPSSYDSSDKGLVTPVKDQGTCGACTAFAADALHEVCIRKAGGASNPDLSVQHLIDCGYTGTSMNGCDGGSLHGYVEYFAEQGGKAPHENSYPYLGEYPKLTCPSNLTFWNSGAEVTDFLYEYYCDATKMKRLIYQYGAVVAGIYASDRGFENYAKGVFYGCSDTRSVHSVLVTGYGTDAATGVDYWIFKNSWGTTWGEKGFGKIVRGKNECGIEDYCVVASCAKKGLAEAPPPPKPPQDILSCDISKTFGTGITGAYDIRTQRGNSIHSAYVRCENSICTPLNPGPKDICMYICGAKTC